MPGERRAALLGVSNIKFCTMDVRQLHQPRKPQSSPAADEDSKMVPKCDVVIGLHTCGGLADCALSVACEVFLHLILFL